MIRFIEDGHKYENTNPIDETKWISVTKFIDRFTQDFNKESVALRCSKNKKSKWFGLTPNEIIKLWDNENIRANELGTYYHNQREHDLCSHDTIVSNGKEIPIFKPIIENNVKIAPDQRLTEGIYPELIVYLKALGICGQADLVEIVDNNVYIRDYKTNKEIKTKGFYNNKTKSTKKMKFPLSHLDDCNFNHYCLQLSLYMYIILRHNRNFNPKELTLYHISFEIDSKDKYDFPIYKKDSDGNFIVNEVVPYNLPYLKNEVATILNTLN